MGVDLFDRNELIKEIQKRERYFRPLHRRMDYWMNMYLLYDAWQDNKPLGERRFISNEPQSIVDTSHRVISRFPIQWWVAIDQYEKTSEDQERLYGDVERALYGFMEDIDEDLVERGDMVARKHAAYQGLYRGKVAVKTHITDQAGRDSNLVYAAYDSRFMLETYDSMGLSSIIALTPMMSDELEAEYPDKLKSVAPDVQCTKIEVWDKEKTGVAYSIGPSRTAITGWCIDPVEHGFFGRNGIRDKGRLNKLPFVIRYVNGLPIKEKPIGAQSLRSQEAYPSQWRAMIGTESFEWRTTRRAIAERGRSILSSIEKHVPQFNEAVSSLWQHFSLDMFGTYFVNTRGGLVPEEMQKALGSGGAVGLERGDSVQRFAPTPVNQSGLQFLSILSEEKQKGTIAAVLQALGEFRSGFLQARMEQVALNALEPFIHGQNLWASGVGQLIIDQVANGQLKNPVQLRYTKEIGAGVREFYRMEFDPAMLKGVPRPVVKGEIEPALPIDMMERAQIANLLVNNRRPLISRSTAQERILRIPDPQRENDRIWEDVAETDPVVIMEQIASALERKGDIETAKIFRDRQMMALVMETAQRIMIQQQLGSLGGGGGGVGGGGQGGQGGPGDQGARGNVGEEAVLPPVAPSTQPPEFTGEGNAQ
jgi:hypothetical protein